MESLPPLTADGRAVDPGGGEYDKQFSAAAAALPSVGATSGVVATSFGWHVLRLLARGAPRSVPFEERRTMFAEEVYARRGHDALEAIESRVRAREPEALANGVDEVLSSAMAALRSQESLSPASSSAAPLAAP